MTEPIVQKLYNLEPARLSYVLCEFTFGKPENQSRVRNGYASLEQMKDCYKTEVNCDAKMLVKTYDLNKQENGKALVLKQEFKEEQIDWLAPDKLVHSVHLIVVADIDCYVDIKQFVPENLFASDRHVKCLSIEDIGQIKFFAQDYSPLKVTQRSRTLNYYYQVTLNNNASLSTGTQVVSHAQDYEYDNFDLRYINLKMHKRDGVIVGDLTSTIRPLGPYAQEITLKITFIPAQKIGALLGG